MVQAVHVCYSIFHPSAERLHQKIVGQLLLELNYDFHLFSELPFTPSRPTASEITPHTITITWRPGVGGPPVKSFTVYHRTKSSSDWTVVTGISGRDSLTLENLKPYTTYQFRVFALNEVGTSKPSSLLEVTTHEKGLYITTVIIPESSVR